MKFSNKVYDILKWITLVALPAFATLWFSISTIWNIPNCEQVLGTITALETFLGISLGISTSQYNKENKEQTK